MCRKCRLKILVLFGSDISIVSKEILSYLPICVNLTSDITVVGSVLVANKANITLSLDHSIDITAYTMVHILTLCDYILALFRNDYYIVAILKFPSLTMLCIVVYYSLVIKLCLAELITLVSFAILSHKVINLDRFEFHNATEFYVVGESAHTTIVVFPILSSCEIVGTHTHFLGSDRGEASLDSGIHFCGKLVCERAERAFSRFKLYPSLENSEAESFIGVSLAVGNKFLDVITYILILFVIEVQTTYADSVYFLCTRKRGDIVNILRGFGAVGYHSVQEIFEVGDGIVEVIGVIGEEVCNLGLARTYLNRCALNAIEDTCIYIEAIVARHSIEGDNDDIAFFAVVRHSD
jgi:hypothetical protein